MEELNNILELLNKTQFDSSEEKEVFINMLINIKTKIELHIDALRYGDDCHYKWQYKQQELEQNIKDDKKYKYIKSLNDSQKKELIERIIRSNPWSQFVFNDEYGTISVDDVNSVY